MTQLKSKRLDILLIEQGLARSRAQAVELIRGALVECYQHGVWQVASKASSEFSVAVPLRLRDNFLSQFVSRAGLKLSAALDHVGLAVEGLSALDIGQSTGGFTDCFLQRGGRFVLGLEVGHGQLAEKLRTDVRVKAWEHFNVRDLAQSQWRECFAERRADVILADVSFISLTLVWQAVIPELDSGAQILALVKPQFEVGPQGLNKRGVVKEESLYDDVRTKICHGGERLGLEILAYFPSVLNGGDGNKEFFVYARKK